MVVFPWVSVEVLVEVVCVVVSEVAVNVDVLVYSEMLMSPGAGLAGAELTWLVCAWAWGQTF